MLRAVILIVVIVLVVLGAGVGVGMLVGGSDSTPSASPAASLPPSPTPPPSPTKPRPAPTVTATATKSVTVPVPGPTIVVPGPVVTVNPAPPPVYNTAVWMWAPPVSPIPYGMRIYVHSGPSASSTSLAEVYAGTSAGIVCSVSGENVTSYAGSSSNWDYVMYPAGGWVADVFLDTRSGGDPDGAIAPRC